MKYLFLVLLMTKISLASDHFNGETFFNPWGINNQKSFFDVLAWKIKGGAQTWPEFVETKKFPLPHPTAQSMVVTWVNHSTFLIQSSSLNILTDPIWSERCSPVSFAGPKRVVKPGIEFDKLPKIDVVIVSHNHYDHLDLSTLIELSKRDRPFILVPLGDKKWLESEGVENVFELDWYETKQFKETQFTFLPAQHWSARGMFDRNLSLWGAWGIDFSDYKMLHAGDTGYGPHFKQIKERWGKADFAMIPVGAYEPRWFMKAMHMNPEDALLAFKDLEASQAVGMHLETFQLTDEARGEPREQFQKLIKKNQIENFEILEIGESRILNRPAQSK